MKINKLLLCLDWKGEVYTKGRIYPVNDKGIFYTNDNCPRKVNSGTIRIFLDHHYFTILEFNEWTRWYYNEE